jgi:hypothetical protein
MQEFSSVTASSYDAESLAPLLTEKAAAGWEVISIVAAGTNVVAYLSRDNAAASSPAAEIETEVAPALSGDDSSHVPAATAVTAETPPEIAGDATVSSAADDTGEQSNDEAVSSSVIAAGHDDAGSADPAAEADTSIDSAAAADAGVPAAPADAASTVPAGWYADPSGRYELRYWDGNAWTEHVSRSGQQFTDPPVA